eukprot:s602_g16.t1
MPGNLQRAAHLGLQCVILPPPRDASAGSTGGCNYARTLGALLHDGLYSMAATEDVAPVALRVPAAAAGWSAWNRFRTLAGHHHRLCVALELTVTGATERELERWLAEPVRYVVLPSSAFILNRSGYPVLPKKGKVLLQQLFRRKVQLIVSGPDATAVDAGDHEGIQSRLSYVARLFQDLPALSQAERFEYSHLDTLQAPLQPLADNLESETYELFEKDPVKYANYQRALFSFFCDRRAQGRPPPFCVMVLGAGRGPLVEAAVKAAAQAEVQVELYAVEKNPNAVHALRHRQRRDGWTSVQLQNEGGKPPLPTRASCRALRSQAMAKVSCALRAFEVPLDMLQTSREVAAEFVSRLDPSLVDIGHGIEVYRLHKLQLDEDVSEGDELLCSLPTWRFDMDALEGMFSELEDSLHTLELRAKHSELGRNFENAAANLLSYGPAVHSDATVQQMRQHLAQRDAQIALEKQTQQKLRADLLAIREQSEHLMQLVLEEAVNGSRHSATASQTQVDSIGAFSAGLPHPATGQRFVATGSPRTSGALRPRYGQGLPRTVVAGDMREWEAPRKADVIVSELLGSFGDNELSPECLDGAQRFLAADGACIPQSYTAALTPVSAPGLWADAQQGAAGGGLADLEAARQRRQPLQ